MSFKISHSRFSSLWPSNAIWHQRSCSALVQVMASCLMAPSHYLDQCWLTILWLSFQGNVYLNTQDINPKLCLKMTYMKSQPPLPGDNELSQISQGPMTPLLFLSWGWCQCLEACGRMPEDRVSQTWWWTQLWPAGFGSFDGYQPWPRPACTSHTEGW